MIRLTRRRLIVGAVAVAVVAGLVWAFWPEPVPVQTATVERGPMRVIVEEEGRTEVAERYAITAPVTAFVRRIELEAGDPVDRGQPVALLEPPRTPVQDPGSRREATARVEAARATAERTAADVERLERLVAADAATPQALDDARAEARRAAAELEAARAALRETRGEEGLDVEEVLESPVAGQVLSVHHRSAGQVSPRDTLVVVGDTGALEVHTDVLSQDAVRIHAGTPVLLEQWGGDAPLAATVRRVEPQGFTSISSLGVEEQRVTVVAGLDPGARAAAGPLGAGYRVLSRFVVWQGEDVLQVPTSALFRVEEAWAVFVVQDGRAERRGVAVGHQAGLRTQVTDGLTEGEVVIVHPGNEIEDGVRVEPMEEAEPDPGEATDGPTSADRLLQPVRSGRIHPPRRG